MHWFVFLSIWFSVIIKASPLPPGPLNCAAKAKAMTISGPPKRTRREPRSENDGSHYDCMDSSCFNFCMRSAGVSPPEHREDLASTPAIPPAKHAWMLIGHSCRRQDTTCPPGDDRASISVQLASGMETLDYGSRSPVQVTKSCCE